MSRGSAKRSNSALSGRKIIDLGQVKKSKSRSIKRNKLQPASWAAEDLQEFPNFTLTSNSNESN
jgi:hypothetical protein